MFFTKLVIPMVLRLILPSLNTKTMLHISFPIPYIFGPVRMNVGAFSLGHVLRPLAEIYITITMDESPVQLRLVFHPKTLVYGPIGIVLFSITMPFPMTPLANVDGVIC